MPIFSITLLYPTVPKNRLLGDCLKNQGLILVLNSKNTKKHYVPRSEHLFKSLQPSLEDLLFLGRSYESLFDRFEVFLALVYADITNNSWGPPGRFAWKYSKRLGEENPFSELIDEAKKDGDMWASLKAGFFQGSHKRFQEIADSYKERLDKLGWW